MERVKDGALMALGFAPVWFVVMFLGNLLVS